MARCLVIGGAGFIGSHLAEALLARDHAVRVLDNFSTGFVSNIASLLGKIELLVGDIADEELVAQAVKGVETIFHHASPPTWMPPYTDPESRPPHYLTQTRNVLTAAQKAGVRRVICASSARVYGRLSCLAVSENHPVHLLSQHAIATLASEQDCYTFTTVSGLETVRLRYANVFGPRQPSASLVAEVIGQAIKAMLVGRRPVIPGDGCDPQDFIFVDDVVHANLLAAEAPRVSGRVFNIGRGRSTTALEIVSLLNRILGTNLRPIHTAPFLSSDLHNLADIARSEIELGFCAFTDLERGLERCVDFYARWRDSLRSGVDEPCEAAPSSLGETGKPRRAGQPDSQPSQR
ncbi:MAG TPA: NAD-dependent epimerase/dehydratase family protein [Gemmataceae bacterium]|nr:NAD-dependent epimerase/dehydratase family protein [Gemmataceae bacterium]